MEKDEFITQRELEEKGFKFYCSYSDSVAYMSKDNVLLFWCPRTEKIITLLDEVKRKRGIDEKS